MKQNGLMVEEESGHMSSPKYSQSHDKGRPWLQRNKTLDKGEVWGVSENIFDMYFKFKKVNLGNEQKIAWSLGELFSDPFFIISLT